MRHVRFKAGRGDQRNPGRIRVLKRGSLAFRHAWWAAGRERVSRSDVQELGAG